MIHVWNLNQNLNHIWNLNQSLNHIQIQSLKLNQNQNQIWISIIDHTDNNKIEHNVKVDVNTTFGELKQIFASFKGVQAKEVCAWVDVRINNNDLTLAQYNIAYDDSIVFMAVDPLVSYYQ